MADIANGNGKARLDKVFDSPIAKALARVCIMLLVVIGFFGQRTLQSYDDDLKGMKGDVASVHSLVESTTKEIKDQIGKVNESVGAHSVEIGRLQQRDIDLDGRLTEEIHNRHEDLETKLRPINEQIGEQWRAIDGLRPQGIFGTGKGGAR